MHNYNVKEDDVVTLNVSGVLYQLKKSKLHRFPGSLLDTLAHAGDFADNTHGRKNYEKVNVDLSIKNNERRNSQKLENLNNSKSDQFFVARVPQMFELIILQTYVTGKLHIPKWMCAESVLDELKFWKLDIEHACTCCEETEETTNDGDSSTDNDSNGTAEIKERPPGKWEKFRRKAWNFVDAPTSSISATIFAIISLLFVLLSTGIFIAGSIKASEMCPNIDNKNISGEFSQYGWQAANENATYLILDAMKVKEVKLSNIDKNGIDSGDLPVFFSTCRVVKILQFLEMTCVIWFTLETLIRLSVCPSFKKFFKHPLNLIDILATLPYYVEVALAYLEYSSPQIQRIQGIFVLIRVMRCLRVFRILKLARYFQELRILGKALKSAKDELCMLGLFIFITTFLFSSIMYQLEKDEPDTQYTSLPASCWWGIVTLTTVGYGDMSPKTIGGKILASVACVAGIIITAFPVSILVEHFTIAYKSKSQPMFLIRRLKTSGKQMIKANSAILPRKHTNHVD